MKNAGKIAETVFNWFIAGILGLSIVLSIPYLTAGPEDLGLLESERSYGSAGSIEGTDGLAFYETVGDIAEENPLLVIDWGEVYEATNTTFDFWIFNDWPVDLLYVQIYASNHTPEAVAEYLVFRFRDLSPLSTSSRLDLNLEGKSAKLVTLDLYVRPGVPRWIDYFNCTIHVNGVWDT